VAEAQVLRARLLRRAGREDDTVAVLDDVPHQFGHDGDLAAIVAIARDDRRRLLVHAGRADEI
jgi:hypothetical protein